MADNPFDVFDAHESSQPQAPNAFDQFDAPHAPTRTTVSATGVAQPQVKRTASFNSNAFDQFDEPSVQRESTPSFADARSSLNVSPTRSPPTDIQSIGELPPDFGDGKVTPQEMQAAGTEFRRLGSIAGQTAASRTLNLGAMAQQATNPGESIAAKLTGLPDEYTTSGQTRKLAEGIAPQVAANDRGGRFAEMIGGLAPDLAAATATGGLAELPAGAGLGARALHGAMSMALPAAENTRQAYERGIANGLTPAQAAGQAAVAGGGTLAMGAIPANVPGDLAERVASGAGIAAAQTEAQRRLSNALLPKDRPDLQQPFDPFELGAGVLTGGTMAGVLGHGGPNAEHVPETVRPGQSTNFVADPNGFLREVGRPVDTAPVQDQRVQPERQPSREPVPPQAQPLVAEMAIGREPGPIAAALSKAPSIRPDMGRDIAEPPSLDARNSAPFEAETPRSIGDVPSDEERGLINPFDVHDEPPAAQVENKTPNFFDRFDEPNNARPIRGDETANDATADSKIKPTGFESYSGDDEVSRAITRERKSGFDPTVDGTHDTRANGTDVAELSSEDLTPAEREAFDRQRSTIVNEHTLDTAPPELRDLIAREGDRSAARDQLRQLSAQAGEYDADRLGLRSAVDSALGDSGIKVNFVRDESGLPDSVKLSDLPDGSRRFGLYDPETKEAYVFTNAAKTPEQAAFTAAHEIAGHNGLRALAASRPDVLVGGRTPARALNDALDLALKNPTVAKIADSMARQRGSSDRYRMAEEAIADLAGAARTGDWNRITDRHGVEVSDSMRGVVRSTVADFIERVKQIVAKLFGKTTFTDAQVHDLVQNAWKATKDSAASRNRGEMAFDSAEGQVPNQGRQSRASEDDLHEAYSVAQFGAFKKMFETAKQGDHTVVSYKGNEIARVKGEPNRTNVAKAIGEQLRQVGAEGPGTKSTKQSAATTTSNISPRRFGESQGDYAKRIVGANKDEIRAATSLRAQQKIIGRHALREMFAKRARAMDTADSAFHEYRKLFDKTDPTHNLANVDAFETGTQIHDPNFRAFLAQMRPGFVERLNRLRELDPNALQHLIAHYIPHMYTDPQRAAHVMSSFAQRRSIADDKSFLKERGWPTLKEAMASGLRPITTNPVDWILLRYAGMDKYIGALELKKELNDRGWLLKMQSTEQPPPGYKRVSDPNFNGYAVPENFARDLTTILDPGFSRYAVWRTLRGAENLMVAADLGFSGFHATMTSTDTVIQHLDIATRRAAMGDYAGAASTFVKALTSVVTSPFEGHRLNQQWRGLREADTNTAAILDALERGGARWKMSSTEYQNAIPKLARMFRQMQGAGITAQLRGKTAGQLAVGAVKVPLTALEAVAETGSWLIHHWLVPNQKMAARVLLYKYELDRRAQALGQSRGNYSGIIDAMHPDVVRQIAAQVNDVVDYRLGQMIYQNRHWNRTVQDIAQAVVMAPGWQVGTLQTVLGAGKAVKDLVSPGKFVAPLDKAGKITDQHMGRVGGNLSYFLTLALSLGGANVILQYLLSGKPYEAIKDAFLPRTGRKADDDSDERLQLPNYWTDHYKLATEPVQTAENKIHPFWKMLWEIGHNRDYSYTQIRDPNAPTLEQAKQVGEYVASKFVPITFGNIKKGMKQGESTLSQVGHFFGVNTAPAKVRRSEFQNFVAEGGDKGWSASIKTQTEADRKLQMRSASAAIRRGDQPNISGLSQDDVQRAQQDAQHFVPELHFKYLSPADKIKAYELATPEERDRYHLRDYLWRTDLDNSAAFKRLPQDRQDDLRQRLRAIQVGR